MLDWSALLITRAGFVTASQGGIGYMLFAVAMTAGRLVGDRVTARFGDRNTLFWGGILSVAGFVVFLATPIAIAAMAGFLLIGLGASNIVPAFFRKAGAQTAMPSALAIGAITTTGYAGILVRYVIDIALLTTYKYQLKSISYLILMYAISMTWRTSRSRRDRFRCQVGRSGNRLLDGRRAHVPSSPNGPDRRRSRSGTMTAPSTWGLAGL